MTRKSFLLRTDPEVLAALQRWAADELRSVNAQIDYVLGRALREAGHYPGRDPRRWRTRRKSASERRRLIGGAGPQVSSTSTT